MVKPYKSMFSLSHTVFTDVRLSTTASLNSPLLLVEQSHWAISWWFPLPQSSLLSSRERGAGPCIKKKKIGCCNLISNFYKDILLWVPTRKHNTGKLWSRADTEMEKHQAFSPLCDSWLRSACCKLCCTCLFSVTGDSVQGDDLAQRWLMGLLSQVTVLSWHGWLSNFWFSSEAIPV